MLLLLERCRQRDINSFFIVIIMKMYLKNLCIYFVSLMNYLKNHKMKGLFNATLVCLKFIVKSLSGYLK